jgi:zinc transport system permease protein
MFDWLQDAINRFTLLFPDNHFFSLGPNVNGLIALILVSIACGAVGSVVVGSRMAFFSDAMAHVAFAGVCLGFIIFEGLLSRPETEFWRWATPVMVIYGIITGLGIAAVRRQTGLASDTVIGVFFAGNIGLAAMLGSLISNRRFFSLEAFLFGNPSYAMAGDLVMLAVLAVMTLLALAAISNRLVLASVNQSLAISRRVPVHWYHAAFVVLLAVIVNVCLRSVGVLLINALLIVPAATAANVSNNLRQMFRRTVIICLFACVTGQVLSWELNIRFDLQVGVSGVIVLFSVFLFVLSMVVGPLIRKQ